MATSRKERDHRYSVSEKGRVRRRRADTNHRFKRRERDLRNQRSETLDNLEKVRKELAQFERIQT